MLTVPPWVRPHQYWWRRTHELCPPLPAALGCGQGQGGGWLRKRTSLRGGPSIGQDTRTERSDVCVNYVGGCCASIRSVYV